MPEITIASQVTELKWAKSTPPRLRIYADIPFLTGAGVPVHAGHPPSGQARFDEPCELQAVTNRVVSPAVTIPSTTDSIDKPNEAKYKAFLYSLGADGAEQYQEFSVFSAGFSLDHTDATQTWEDVRVFNLDTLPTLSLGHRSVAGDLDVAGGGDFGGEVTADGFIGDLTGNVTGATGTFSGEVTAANFNGAHEGDGSALTNLATAGITQDNLSSTGSTEMHIDSDNSGTGRFDVYVGPTLKGYVNHDGGLEFAYSKTPDKGGQVFNVKAFGATGDGVTDDTAAINSAITTAAVLGGSVFVPPGTYIVDNVLPLDDTHLFGAGYASHLKLKAGLATGHKVLNINKGGSKYMERVTVENLRLDGSGESYTVAGAENEVVNADNTRDLTIRFCWIENSGSDGIDCDGENVGLRIIGNRIRDCGAGGMHLYGPANSVVAFNHVENCGRNWTTADTSAAPAALDIVSEQQGGVVIGPSRNIVIIGNTFKDCNHGVNVGSATGIVIKGNEFYNMDANAQVVAGYGAGISINPTVTGAVVEGNFVDDTFTDGIYGAGQVTKGNIVLNAGARGISVGATGCTVEGNHVKSSVGTGITASARAEIIGNRVESAGANGIDVGTVAGHSVRDNTVISPTTTGINFSFRSNVTGNTVEGGVNGIVASGSVPTESVIAGNTVRGTTDHGISAAANGVKIHGNYVQGVTTNNKAGINVITGANMSVVGNDVTGCYWGILVGAALSASLVAANKCLGNTNTDIIVSGSVGAGNILRANMNSTGAKNHNTGTATVTAAATSVLVTHGLWKTPALADINVKPTNSLGTATKWWISTPTSTQFTINLDAVPGASTATFSWSAEVL